MAKAKTIDVKSADPGQVTKDFKLNALSLYLSHTKADRQLRALLDKSLKSHNLSLMHWLVLSSLAKFKTGLTMTEIADLLGVNLPQATSLINYLKNEHLVIQKADRQDRRQKQVVISVKGRALLRLVNPSINSLVEALLKSIPANHLVFYNRVVNQLSK
jgi:DNA-binding MarR family transcriptional regulator